MADPEAMAGIVNPKQIDRCQNCELCELTTSQLQAIHKSQQK